MFNKSRALSTKVLIAGGALVAFLMLVFIGYHLLYAAREILLTDSGNGMFILEEMNGRRPPGGYMLACTADYYADRGLWGISHIVRFRLSREGSLL